METQLTEVVEQQNEKDKNSYPKLDYTITDTQERNKLVHEIIAAVPTEKLTPYYLEQLARYLAEEKTTKQNKKERKILTNNRMISVNRREISFQGLIAKLENGEDGIYNLMTGGDKNILFIPKISITDEDVETIPGLKELQEEIKKIEIQQKAARGKRKFLLIQQLKQMRKDQYILKSAYKPPVSSLKITKSLHQIDLSEKITIDENGDPISTGLISFFNPHHVCCLLCNYSKLKQDSWGCFENDLYYLMEDFDKLIDKTLKDNYPILYDIMIYKIDGLQNKQIVEKIKQKYNVSYSIEYISTIWRKKIPKLISNQAKKDWIIWHYTFEEKGKWKRCSRCHEIKLAHPYFFSKNKTSKDGYYSLCKECRNKKIVLSKDKKL